MVIEDISHRPSFRRYHRELRHISEIKPGDKRELSDDEAPARRVGARDESGSLEKPICYLLEK